MAHHDHPSTQPPPHAVQCSSRKAGLHQVCTRCWRAELSVACGQQIMPAARPGGGARMQALITGGLPSGAWTAWWQLPLETLNLSAY